MKQSLWPIILLLCCLMQACGVPPPHVILIISDGLGLSEDAQVVAVGNDLITMKEFDLSESSFPLTLTLRADVKGERVFWVEARKGDEVLARGRVRVDFRRKKTRRYTIELLNHCKEDGSNDEAACSLEDPDLAAGDCVAGVCVASGCGDGTLAANEICDDGNTVEGDYCSSDCQTIRGSCGDGNRQDNEVCEDGNVVEGDYCSADCLRVIGACGDGEVQDNEVCDDGNMDEGDYCSSDCQTITGYCGDSLLQNGEACDDGNNVGGDYCSDDCLTELGFCGDSVLQNNESCDDGNPASGDGDGCPGDCLDVEDGWSCVVVGESCAEICGDGLLVGAEVCDDGNTLTHDGCAEDCRSIQSGWECATTGQACSAICGDDFQVETQEECDDGNTITETCTYGSPDLCTVCNSECQEEAGIVTYCGDTVIDAANGEVCDDGRHCENGLSCTQDSDCESGNCRPRSISGCAEDCLSVISGWECSVGEPCTPICGDGIVRGDEACDDGNLLADGGCAADCSAIESGWLCLTAGQPCVEDCGDGMLVGDEVCDDGNKDSGDGCNSFCTLIATGWSCETPGQACIEVCGNGIVTAGEACDDGTGTTANPVPEDTITCDVDCTQVSCQDGYANIVAGEACDDGNAVDGDGCDSNCTPTGCGNTIVTDGEDCDDGNSSENDYCNNDCTANGSCGDNELQSDVEECDDGNADNTDECLNSCVNASCGDGFVRTGVEDCDDGNAYEMDDCSPSCADTVLAVHELALGFEFSCVLFSNGRIGCWGNAGNGRLGRGDSEQIGDSNPDGENPYELYDDLVYVDLGDNGRAKEIVAGEKFACALLNNGGVKCWGDNSAGQLGLGDNVSRGTDPADMGNNLPAIDFGTTSVVEDVCAGDKHACVLFADDTMKCWGDNFAGQLGQGDTADRGDAAGEMGTDLPTVDLGAGFVPSKIDCAGQVSCAFGQGGVKCWGNNGYGQLGQGLSANIGDDPDEIGENLPAINLGTGVVAADVIAGPNNVCAMLDDGTIKCWGDQMFSQLYPGYGVGSFGNPIGDESDEMGDDLETYVLDDDVLQILHGALGRHEICVVMDTVYREIKCWGYLHSWPNDNTRGSNGHDAVFVPNTEAVVEKLFIGDNHAGGWVHGCALLQGGAVRCWGDNTSGQLGLGDTIARQVINGNFLPDLQLIAP